MLTEGVDRVVQWICARAGDGYFAYPMNVRGLLAVVLVSLVCGAVGSLVVGNRMAFFSDALAHCTFAGVALGLLLALVLEVAREQDVLAVVTLVMVGFGILVGVGIFLVRETTSLASDTVIGVFFAGAMGFGAVLLKALSSRTYYNPENFLFGDLVTVRNEDLVYLFLLAVVSAVVLALLYNPLAFSSFNASLARSRRVRVRLCRFVFIVLLALIVNLTLKIVGALLINALLIVPAATAANFCRNLRQMFWWTVVLCLVAGLLGQYLSWVIQLPDPRDPRNPIQFGGGGIIVVLSVLMFFVSVLLGMWLRRPKAA
jgi:zinc transport system permease protein